MNIIKLVFVLGFIFFGINLSQETGKYFAKKEYIKESLPNFNDSKHLIPSPIMSENIGWIDMYWKSWEIAFKGLKQPSPNSPLVSNWIDEAFSDNIFQWDTIFMILFARYAHNVFPAIESLDNFYALQRESGYIGREFRESDGKIIHYDDGDLFHPNGWKNTINPPLFSWVEIESFKLTGDLDRLKLVLPALEKYAEWLDQNGDPDDLSWEENGRRSINSVHKLFWNTSLGSGMDNTPRPTDDGAGWVEMSSQIVLMYNKLAEICDELNYSEKSIVYKNKARAIAENINKWCWNEDTGFYFDVLADGTQFKKKTIGGFWPLIAEVATEKQVDRLIEHLVNPNEFWRKNVFPSLSADEKEYDSTGGYWLGGVWAPTNVMVIKGLEKYGYEELATRATKVYLDGMYKVFEETQTVWENYAPDYYKSGQPAKPDFVGWSGCGPISLLIENVLGFRVNGVRETITWKISQNYKHGIRNLWLGENKVDLIFSPKDKINNPIVKVRSDTDFTLVLRFNNNEFTYKLLAGENVIKLVP